MKRIRTECCFIIIIILLVSVYACAEENNCFMPGRIWKDRDGTHINAHGGGILIHNDTYYFFGAHMVEGRIGNSAQVGVRCYSSKDLYNWKNEGVALAVSRDSESDIAQGCILERPKVIYNEKTKKFVMWFHLELKETRYLSARSGVAISDKATGPYEFIRSFRPNANHWPQNMTEDQKKNFDSEKAKGKQFSGGPDPQYNIIKRDHFGGQMARDMTLFVDDDKKAYHIYSSEENSTLHISQLTDDYLAPAGKYIRIFEQRYMEAPAICKRNGKYYLLMSGCSGWKPNAARSAVADSIMGPWKELKNPCVGEGKDLTFGGQSTHILKVSDKKDAYIAMFDIWRPTNPNDGRYIWLPINFKEEGFEIKYYEKWDLSYFK